MTLTDPLPPTAVLLADRAQALLEVLAGPDARLRPDQLAALEAVVGQRRRALVVQRTGFGKSAIYFIATRLLRDAGAGPTLLVSPLLALMRDQVAAAERMGVRSATINSTNLDEWREVEAQVAAGEIDLLCVSPERLNNRGFVDRVLPALSAGLGMLVIDEAHCISDWGHDFRPDYRRIRDAIAHLVPGTPVIATTATANARVQADVAEQLGDGVLILRGPLDRESLALSVAALPSMAERLAWLADRIPRTTGTGIVYCLTVAQTTLVAEWLASCGIDAHAYSGDTDPEERARLEARFKGNGLKALVATSALGMGVDKPDVTFVFHLGAPPSPIAYYQQVGRAGRSVPRAEACLLPGEEDQRIWKWFADVGLPDEPLVRRVLDALGEAPRQLANLEVAVDLRRSRLETVLKILDVDGAVRREPQGWVQTDQPWTYDHARVARVREARRDEAQAMLDYPLAACLMAFLRTNLDDEGAVACGRCGPCLGLGPGDHGSLDPVLVAAAVAFLRKVDVVLEPRKQWPTGRAGKGGRILAGRRAEEGRALCREGDAGWWPLVAPLVAREAVDGAQPAIGDELVTGIAATLKRWAWNERPRWVTWVPSQRASDPARLVAEAIGALGKLPVIPALVRTRSAPPQSAMANSSHRAANVGGAFAIAEALAGDDLPDGPVLVVDDVVDSGWTMTVVADLLRGAGSGPILPFALVRA